MRRLERSSPRPGGDRRRRRRPRSRLPWARSRPWTAADVGAAVAEALVREPGARRMPRPRSEVGRRPGRADGERRSGTEVRRATPRDTPSSGVPGSSHGRVPARGQAGGQPSSARRRRIGTRPAAGGARPPRPPGATASRTRSVSVSSVRPQTHARPSAPGTPPPNASPAPTVSTTSTDGTGISNAPRRGSRRRPPVRHRSRRTSAGAPLEQREPRRTAATPGAR